MFLDADSICFNYIHSGSLKHHDSISLFRPQHRDEREAILNDKQDVVKTQTKYGETHTSLVPFPFDESMLKADNHRRIHFRTMFE